MLSIKNECLDRIVPLGEGHLRSTISEYIEHDHRERNNQGFDNNLIVENDFVDGSGKVVRRERLGGLLSFYY